MFITPASVVSARRRRWRIAGLLLVVVPLVAFAITLMVPVSPARAVATIAALLCLLIGAAVLKVAPSMWVSGSARDRMAARRITASW